MENNSKLIQGNEACVYGALYAGMRFFAGYPITPSTEVAEFSAQELPKVEGKFIQMEDEIASMAAIIGASIAGVKSMTATSGPGFSLKQENLGYAAMAEIPCVVVNVQRSGPSTGLPTSPSQGDYMQARWGTHGDHPIIALTPTSVRETFDLTVKAFNFSEKYRTPVILLTDEIIGHLRERMEFPSPGELEIIDRKRPTVPPSEYKAYEFTEDLVPPMADFGTGYRYHITGLFHEETGFPTNSHEKAGQALQRIMDKIEKNLEDILIYEELQTQDAEILIVSYGGTARSAKDAINVLRQQGIKAGLFIPKTVWPFPTAKMKELGDPVKHIFVAEMNLGQMIHEVKLSVKDHDKVHGIFKANGDVIYPEEIVKRCMEVK